MKVTIGPFINWWGPYQITGLLKHVGVSEDTCHKLGEKSPKWFTSVCEWIHSKRKRTVIIKVDKWDSWNADSTLAIIILPVLKQLRLTKHGAPYTEDSDVPPDINLRASECYKDDADAHDTDKNHFKRWDWILDEIIWSFEQLQPDCDWEDQYRSGVHDTDFKELPNGSFELVKGPNDTYKCDYDSLKLHQDRIRNGTILFGKYYQNLWD